MSRTRARGLALAVLGMLLMTVMAGPALAVGADGVSMQLVVPGDVNQRMPMLVEGVPAAGEVRLRNDAQEERTVRLYAAQAAQEDGGAVFLGDAGSAPWMGLDVQELVLGPGERRTVPFEVRPAGVPADTDGRLPTAVVLEVPRGGTVVLQAVSLLSVTGAVAPALPWQLVLVAAALLLVVGEQSARQLRRRAASRPATVLPAPA